MSARSSGPWICLVSALTIGVGGSFAYTFGVFDLLRVVFDYEHELRAAIELLERDPDVRAEASRKHEDISLEDFDIAIWTANYPPVGLVFAESLGSPSQRIDGLVFQFESGTSTFDRQRLLALGVNGDRLSDVVLVFSKILVAAFTEPLDDPNLWISEPAFSTERGGPVFSPESGGSWIQFAPPRQTALMLYVERHLEKGGNYASVLAAGEQWFATTWGAERFGEQGPPKEASANR